MSLMLSVSNLNICDASSLRVVPFSQLSPSRGRKEVGEKNKSAPHENSFRAAPIDFLTVIFFLFSLARRTKLGKRDCS